MAQRRGLESAQEALISAICPAPGLEATLPTLVLSAGPGWISVLRSNTPVLRPEGPRKLSPAQGLSGFSAVYPAQWVAKPGVYLVGASKIRADSDGLLPPQRLQDSARRFDAGSIQTRSQFLAPRRAVKPALNRYKPWAGPSFRGPLGKRRAKITAKPLHGISAACQCRNKMLFP